MFFESIANAVSVYQRVDAALWARPIPDHIGATSLRNNVQHAVHET